MLPFLNTRVHPIYSSDHGNAYIKLKPILSGKRLGVTACVPSGRWQRRFPIHFAKFLLADGTDHGTLEERVPNLILLALLFLILFIPFLPLLLLLLLPLLPLPLPLLLLQRSDALGTIVVSRRKDDV